MPRVPESLVVALLLVAGVFAPVSAWVATRRSRRPAIWFVFGALIGPAALAILALAPPGRCPTCGAPIRGWPEDCPRCGAPLPAVLHQPGGGRVPTAGPAAPPVEAPGSATGVPLRASAPVATQPPASAPVATEPPTRSRPARDQRRHPMGRTRSPAPVIEVLGSGIYISGNAGLDFGARYGVARVSIAGDERLRVFGPIDIGQMTIRHDGRLEDLEVIVSDDRVVVAGRQGRSTLMVVLRIGPGASASELEAILQSGRYLPGW